MDEKNLHSVLLYTNLNVLLVTTLFPQWLVKDMLAVDIKEITSTCLNCWEKT